MRWANRAGGAGTAAGTAGRIRDRPADLVARSNLYTALIVYEEVCALYAVLIISVLKIPLRWNAECGIQNAMRNAPPVTVKPISGQVYDYLERAIVECAYEPGTTLKDAQLAEEIGVSRTPVRDALHLLESSGLVRRHGRTWLVTPIETRDVEELFELRCLLEPAGLPYLVKWEEQRLRSFTSMFDEFPGVLDDAHIERYLKRDDEFHQQIVSAADNGRLTAAYQVVDRQLDRCRHFTSYRYEGRVSQSLTEHRRICAALLQRDADEARVALLDHINIAREKLIATLQATVGRSTGTS